MKYFSIDDDYLNCKNDSDIERYYPHLLHHYNIISISHRNCQSAWTVAATSVSFACTAYEVYTTFGK